MDLAAARRRHNEVSLTKRVCLRPKLPIVFLLEQDSWGSLLEIALRAMILFYADHMFNALARAKGRVAVHVIRVSVVVTLAGAFGVPLQAIGRGLLPPSIIMLSVIMLHYSMARWSVRSPRFETVILGSVRTIIHQGNPLDELKRAALSRERLFAMLRQHQVQHLSLDVSGSFGCWNVPHV
ncbi:hypothetical protein A986_16766 [Pseudomonas fluorescens BRIP34879]|nr:hypothetical protein A986_16766 [Pseudomonas fluorescens BRIP34879]